MAKSCRRGKGEGSIRKRKDGRWEGSITVGITKRGNPKRLSRYGKTRSEVAEQLNLLLVQKGQGTLPAPNKLTLGEWVTQWVSSKTNVDELTRFKYTRETACIHSQIGRVKLQALKPIQIRQFYNSLSKENYSLRAQRKAATHLRSALREAVQLELIPRSPAEGIKLSLPRVEAVAKAMTPEEVSRFLEVSKSSHIHALFRFTLLTGLRKGEVLGLEWRHVDFHSGTVRVEQTFNGKVEKGKHVIKQTKTNSSRRTLYLSEDTKALLLEHKKSKFTSTRFVFSTRYKKPISPGSLSKSFGLCVAKLGSTFRFHDLRHTYASLALRYGVPLEVVSKNLGHADPRITLQLYRHLYESERKDSALNLSDLLKGKKL